jgi:sorbitol-specific phosphotransferase system component IIA
MIDGKNTLSKIHIGYNQTVPNHLYTYRVIHKSSALSEKLIVPRYSKLKNAETLVSYPL